MGEIDFSDEEIRYIEAMSAEPASLPYRIGTNAAYLAPSIIFGVYGLISGSFKIVGIAFICMLLLYAWGLVSEIRDHKYSLLAYSVFSKLRSAMRKAEG